MMIQRRLASLATAASAAAAPAASRTLPPISSSSSLSCSSASSTSMLRSSPSSSRVTLPLLSRCLSTTPSACESMAATREKYESKYAERLRAKARAEGLGEDVAGLKERAKREGKLTPRMKELVSRKPGQGEEAATTSLGTEAKKREKPVFAPAKPKSPSSSRVGTSSERRDKSPIKPLDEIVDLAKLISEPSVERIAQIWNGYHQSLSATPALSAVIPYETYLKMAEMGSRYPSFVVPLPREVQPEQGEGQSLPEMKDKKQVGAEMHFLQWAFHPSPPESGLPPSSTVLYTPLALFKSQSTYAPPHLILTHYVDLVHTHGVVLMRGDITPDVSTKVADGQVLTLRLQQFYQGSNERRTRLLRDFHENQEKFSVEELVDSVGEV